MKSDKLASFRLFFGLVSLVVSIGLVRSIVGHLTKQDIVGLQETVLTAEKNRKEELEKRLVEATSAAFIEKQAREKLGMAKPEDTIVLLDTPSAGNGQAQDGGEKYAPNWKQWWRLFF